MRTPSSNHSLRSRRADGRSPKRPFQTAMISLRHRPVKREVQEISGRFGHHDRSSVWPDAHRARRRSVLVILVSRLAPAERPFASRESRAPTVLRAAAHDRADAPDSGVPQPAAARVRVQRGPGTDQCLAPEETPDRPDDQPGNPSNEGPKQFCAHV